MGWILFAAQLAAFDASTLNAVWNWATHEYGASCGGMYFTCGSPQVDRETRSEDVGHATP
jgi:hypothetical protein